MHEVLHDFHPYEYTILAGYSASLGPLPLSASLPFAPHFYPHSLGRPGFTQNICSVIAQDYCIPEILFKT